MDLNKNFQVISAIFAPFVWMERAWQQTGNGLVEDSPMIDPHGIQKIMAPLNEGEIELVILGGGVCGF